MNRVDEQLRSGCCRECGQPFEGIRYSREFCSSPCRAAFHNRRSRRGAEIFDLAMGWRFDRRHAAQTKALTLLCRMLARFREEDRSARQGRHSWDDAARVKIRRPDLQATVVGIKVAGVTRRSAVPTLEKNLARSSFATADNCSLQAARDAFPKASE